MSISINVSITGSPNELDVRAATLIIEEENARRLANVDGNGDPILPQLPYANLSQLAASYETYFDLLATQAHSSYVKRADKISLNQAKAAWDAATDAQRAAALAALTS